MSVRFHRRLRSPFGLGRPLGWLAILVGTLIALGVVVTPAEPEQQAFIAIGGFLVFMIANRIPGRGVSVFLVMLSSIISMRYIYWRLTDTLDYSSFIETFLGTGLLLAEIYAVLVLLLSYFQSTWPLERKPAPLPNDPADWPSIDVYIPSYNEPLSVVKPTVFGALAMDWPGHKMNIYILDDGRREDFRAFAEQVGCGYIIRPDNKGAKAGNINHALTKTKAPFIVIFDCDHVPTRAFLQLTIGWMLRDEGIGMLQTPHHFYSPDPFERNLAAGNRVPNEGLLFYGLVQQGNDLWNATFFCGSCAVLRRTAILEVGGVPTETVTEDCHCSLKMQRRGWRTAYLRIPLAAGLATDRLLSHIGQRMRWARGMVQIMRIDTPFLGPGLSLAQRICYFNAQLHFLFPLPRFVFLTSPLAFLLFGQSIIAASPLAIMAYAAPHIMHSLGTNSRMQSRVRHSWWSEIYETALALWLLPVVVTTLLDPKKGKFNVTDKGGTLNEGFFDMRAVGPNFVLGLALAAGLLTGFGGMILNPFSSLEFQAYALNSIWVVLSFIVVLAGLAVGRERRQVRERHRVNAVIGANIILPDGSVVGGESLDLSLGGAAIAAAAPAELAADSIVMCEFDCGQDSVTIPAEVLRWNGNRLQVRFAPQDLRDEGNIVRAVLGRADAWVDWDDNRPDHPLRSLGEVARSIGGLFVGESQFKLGGRRKARAAAARQFPARPANVAAGTAADVVTDPPADHVAGAPSTAAVVEAARRSAAAKGGVRAAAALLALGLSLALPGAAQAQRLQAPAPPPPINRQAPLPQGTPAPGAQQQSPFAQPPSTAQAPALPPGTPTGTSPGPSPGGSIFAPSPAPASGGPAFGIPQQPAMFGAGAGGGPGTRIESRTLRQLGLRSPMQLRGLSDLQGILFGIRGDEVVTGARLVLQGASSPALIPELSQIAISLNEQFVGTITPDRARPAFGPLEFPINPVFFADNNRLNFRFTGRYAIECNDPLSGLLWSTISDLSVLHLTLERLPMQRDLARLPEPFFDPRLLREPLNLTMVMPEAAGNEVIKAATIASSWFAVQADYRGANFPVSPSVPQTGNAVVIATGSESIPGLALPRLDGPTLALVPNPTDPNGLLLVIAGRSGAETVTAAQALAIGREALSGEIATVTVPEMAPRQAYDAPRWVRSDRPVKLGELVDPSELQSFGFAPGPVSIPFRTAPDLYTWRDKQLPIDIKFRAPPGPILDVATSRLDVALNDVYLKSFPLRQTDPGFPWNWAQQQLGMNLTSDRGEGLGGLPPYMIFGLNELQLRFDMRPLNRGDCISIPGDIRAAIDPDSTIDLSTSFRFTKLPNLAFFTGSGFPFTKYADFGGTAGVLPERPNGLELSSFFTMIGRLAANVGHPATRIEIVRPGALQQVADRDLFVIGALGRQPAIQQLIKDGPIQIEGNKISVALPDDLAGFRNLFLGDDQKKEREKLQAILQSPGDGTGVLMGFESPLTPSRSVLVLTGTTPQGIDAMVGALRDPEQSPRVQGDLALLQGGRISAFKVGGSYQVGSLPIYLLPQWWLSSRPELLLVMLAVAALVIAIPTYWALRRRAALRLRTRTQ